MLSIFFVFCLYNFLYINFPVPKQTFLTYHPIPSSHIDFSLPAPNRVDIVRFGPKEVLTALKHVYLVKKSLYIYSARNFLPYPMWDITSNFSGWLCVTLIIYSIKYRGWSKRRNWTLPICHTMHLLQRK